MFQNLKNEFDIKSFDSMGSYDEVHKEIFNYLMLAKENVRK